jgi:hypothetical protein
MSRIPYPSGRFSPPDGTANQSELTAKLLAPIGAGLFAANAVVVRAPQRQGSGKRFGHKMPPKSPRHPESYLANRPRDRELHDPGREGLGRGAAKASHSVPPVISDPGIDLAL